MKVLVAVDSSNYADEILEQLVARTWPSGSVFEIISIVEPSPNWQVGQELMQQCKIILDGRVDYLKKRLPQTDIVGQVLEGEAAKVIIATALEWPADLLVIGSHGDTGKRMAKLGSVAADVVNGAKCSVEVIKVRQTKGPGGHAGTVAASAHKPG